MTSNVLQLSQQARRAIQAKDWGNVGVFASSILKLDINNAEGHFLSGMVEKVAKRHALAINRFEQALILDNTRYDAAIELANQYSIARRNADAAELLEKYKNSLTNSSLYSDLAGTIYTEIGLPEKAFPLYQRANEIQPGIDLFQANLAACGVYLGKIKQARAIYTALLTKNPNHQRNHYHLSRLAKSKDSTHIQKMQQILADSPLPPERNVFIYYALGKELEDIGRWEEAFSYYKTGADAVCNIALHDTDADIRIINSIIQHCNADWLQKSRGQTTLQPTQSKTPIFIVGLPRTGTTLTERIISSHSAVQTLGETQFLQLVLRRESGVQSNDIMNEEMIASLSKIELKKAANAYIEMVSYRLGREPFFIDKLPFNFLFLGFIAKAWPNAKIIHLGRNPMDACFAMYKQIFTWAYKFSYSLDSLGQYYVAYDKLRQHWREVLQDRLIEVEYEALVSNPEEETKKLLAQLGLSFEQGCIDFDKNDAPSATASSVQIREKVHRRSINKWQRFSKELQPLKAYLESEGIQL